MTEELVSTADLLAGAAAFQQQGRPDLAEHLYRRAVQADPTSLKALHLLGRTLELRGQFEEAEAAYRRVLQAAPGAPSTATALGQLLLGQGRYEDGFAFFEGRFGVTPERAKPSLPYPEWRGEDLAGRSLLIWIEQGFGDQIQFARFAPILKDRGADVTLLCLQPLERLFAANLGVRVVGTSGQVSFPDPDYWTMTCSLAWRLGVGPHDIPAEPYLRAPFAAPALPPGFKVGIMATGSPAHANDANRSLPAEQAQRLKAMAATVIDLSPDSTGARDFAETAALIDQLDLVVSVDTSVAHLAGAMGKPCWVLLPAIGVDWRWFHERTDSPWYPTARLYRQSKGGGWGEVIDRVLADVRATRDAVDSHRG
jgi:tetratricopeptide (TPR) repeat protein